MEVIRKALGNAPVFVIAYIVFMLPTYVLPYVGSNSSVLHGMDAAMGTKHLNYAFWFHFGSMLILCFLSWVRGTYVNRKWLIVFPSLAIFFDFMPGFSSIPMFPTFMHLAAIISGIVGAKRAELPVVTSTSDNLASVATSPVGHRIDVTPVEKSLGAESGGAPQAKTVISDPMCRHCGTSLDTGDSYCTECGSPIR